jgi:hypothetical protein
MSRDKATKIGKAAGCGGCGCGALFIMLLGGFLYIALFTNTFARMMGEETYPLASDPKEFDPFAALDDVRKRVGSQAILVSIEADFVRSDGTMDLTATYSPAPRVTYTFVVQLDPPPVDAPPIGAGRAPGDVWLQQVSVVCYEPGQRRSVTRISGGSRSQYTYTNEGMDVDRGSPRMGKLPADIGAPKVSTANLWSSAMAKGAPRDAVSRISFNKDGYEFSVTGLKVGFELDREGKPRTR